MFPTTSRSALVNERNTSNVSSSRFLPWTAWAALPSMYPDSFQCVYILRTAANVTFRLTELRGPRSGLQPVVFFLGEPLSV